MNSSHNNRYRLKNSLQLVLLISTMLLILSLIGWLFAGKTGVIWAMFIGLFLFLSIPNISPHALLSMNGAKPLSYTQAPEIHNIVQWLAEQAGLQQKPELYFIPRNTLIAYSVGKQPSTAIAISNGLLQILNKRELIAVIAHEISHIVHNDILVMQVTQIIHIITSMFALMAYLTILIYLPVLYLGEQPMPWVLLLILIIAPNLSVMIQLAISRLREFDADMEAVKITNDPLALASALQKLENYQQSWFQRLTMSHRRLYIPKILNTHPSAKERIRRLKEMAEKGLN